MSCLAINGGWPGAGICDRCLGQQSITGWWEIVSVHCFVHLSLLLLSLFPPPFAVLLNCLYFSPWVLLFVSSSPLSLHGGKREWLRGPSCQLGLYQDTLDPAVVKRSSCGKKAVRSLIRASSLWLRSCRESQVLCLGPWLRNTTGMPMLGFALCWSWTCLVDLTSWIELQNSSSPQTRLANTRFLADPGYHYQTRSAQFVQSPWDSTLLCMSPLCQPCHHPVGFLFLVGNHPSLPPESDRSCLWLKTESQH